MVTFALAVLVLAATPGPALLSIVAVGSAFGFRQGTRYVIGAVAGANIVILMYSKYRFIPLKNCC